MRHKPIRPTYGLQPAWLKSINKTGKPSRMDINVSRRFSSTRYVVKPKPIQKNATAWKTWPGSLISHVDTSPACSNKPVGSGLKILLYVPGLRRPRANFVGIFVANFVDCRTNQNGLRGVQRNDKAHDKARDKDGQI